jgi:hypothetical protein
MKIVLFSLLVLLCGTQNNEGAKILGIFTVPSRSHSILAYELFKELVKSGHEVMDKHLLSRTLIQFSNQSTPTRFKLR